MKQKYFFFVITSVCLFGSFCLGYISVHASSADMNAWFPDKKIPGYMDDTFTPFLLADQNNTVHAFASQWVVDGDSRRRAIVYRQWTLRGGWTRPVDVLLAPIGDAYVIGAYIDGLTGILYVVYWGGKDTKGNIYYAHALTAEAYDAASWSLPELVGSGAIYPSYGAIAGDDQGNLVIIYNGNTFGNGVYAVMFDNAENKWSSPKPVLLTENLELAPYFIKTYVGESGRFHVVSGVNGIGGIYDSLYYIGYNFLTKKWAMPILLDKRPDINEFFGPSFPAVVDNGHYIVVMYNGGNPFPGYKVDVGRPTLLVRLSTDGGLNWEGITNPIPFLTGNSGELSLVVDNAQVVHSLSIMRIDSGRDGQYRAIGGIWHNRFADGIWSYPERFVPSINAANLSAVISQGYVLLMTWIEDAGNGQDEGVWYSYKILDAPELPIIVLPTGTPSSTSLSATPPPVYSEPTHSLSPKPSIGGDSPPVSNYSPATPVIIGVITSIFLIFVVVMNHLRRRSRT